MVCGEFYMSERESSSIPVLGQLGELVHYVDSIENLVLIREISTLCIENIGVIQCWGCRLRRLRRTKPAALRLNFERNRRIARCERAFLYWQAGDNRNVERNPHRR